MCLRVRRNCRVASFSPDFTPWLVYTNVRIFRFCALNCCFALHVGLYYERFYWWFYNVWSIWKNRCYCYPLHCWYFPSQWSHTVTFHLSTKLINYFDCMIEIPMFPWYVVHLKVKWSTNTYFEASNRWLYRYQRKTVHTLFRITHIRSDGKLITAISETLGLLTLLWAADTALPPLYGPPLRQVPHLTITLTNCITGRGLGSGEYSFQLSLSEKKFRVVGYTRVSAMELRVSIEFHTGLRAEWYF